MSTDMSKLEARLDTRLLPTSSAPLPLLFNSAPQPACDKGGPTRGVAGVPGGGGLPRLELGDFLGLPLGVARADVDAREGLPPIAESFLRRASSAGPHDWLPLGEAGIGGARLAP